MVLTGIYSRMFPNLLAISQTDTDMYLKVEKFNFLSFFEFWFSLINFSKKKQVCVVFVSPIIVKFSHKNTEICQPCP